ncbi:MAG: AbrB/MazE/SpoVT family DNA-binding domain-containing protein [Firmicutes bacterium]|nr:AbrB/MazE/SpoVT family DNA-binding domain-containing protein [Bacillota bacterium]
MLKNTGVIRKIDELGRIVIPKELRKVLNINSGDDLEIYVDDQKIVLKKYSRLLNNQEESNKLINSVSDLIESKVFISDKERVITFGELENRELPLDFKNILNERRSYSSKNMEEQYFENKKIKGYYLVEPIIQNSDANGLVILCKNENITEEDKIFAKVLKNIIENK